MGINISDIKKLPILETERAFFLEHKKNFVQTFTYTYQNNYNCEYCELDEKSMAENLFDLLFDNTKDNYKEYAYGIVRLHVNKKDVGFLINELNNQLIEHFLQQDREASVLVERLKDILQLCKKIQLFLQDTLTQEYEKLSFAQTLDTSAKNATAHYFHNLQNLGRNIKFFIHAQIGTNMSYASIQQVSNHSIVIKASDEQVSMLGATHTAFIIHNRDDEKNFRVFAKILCPKNNTLVIENFQELETLPLLSRKYPRAKIIHTSLVHIANENQYLSGNLLDISESGVGILSSEKSSFEKGQEIVAFISYEDENNGVNFSFEASGYIVSIIGNENAFRYGVALNLSSDEKDLIKNLLFT
ncbi:MAG: PilZ domain-containing protein [Sulfurospirillum sp.]|nr:PilZ domain-containing protein [Sulfurospirillum sp.]